MQKAFSTGIASGTSTSMQSVRQRMIIESSIYDGLMLQRRTRVYKNFAQKYVNFMLLALVCVFFYLARQQVTLTLNQTGKAYMFWLDASIAKINSFLWSTEDLNSSFAFTGLEKLSRHQMIEAINSANIDLRSSPLKTIKQVILQNPLVESATISRNIARRTINISIVERDIIGYFNNFSEDNSIMLLDVNGNSIKASSSILSALQSIEVIGTINYRNFLELYSYLRHKNLHDITKSATFISNRRWDLRFKNGLLVKLPANNWHNAINVLLSLDKKINVLQKNNQLLYIDLRTEEKIFLR